jgi:hypothetical protein
MSDYHNTCKREQKVGFVLGKIGVLPQSPLGDLLSPGVRGFVDKKNGVEKAIDFFANNPTVQRKLKEGHRS